MSEHAGENCGNCVIPISSVPKEAQLFQKLTQRNDTRTCSEVHQNKVMCKISAQYVKACRRKVRKTGGRRPGRTDGESDGRRPGRTSPYHNTSRLKLNMSEHAGENCGNCNSYIISSKRGTTLSKIDAKERHSNLL